MYIHTDRDTRYFKSSIKLRSESRDQVFLSIATSPKPQYADGFIYKEDFVDDFHEFYKKPPPAD